MYVITGLMQPQRYFERT